MRPRGFSGAGKHQHLLSPGHRHACSPQQLPSLAYCLPSIPMEPSSLSCKRAEWGLEKMWFAHGHSTHRDVGIRSCILQVSLHLFTTCPWAMLTPVESSAPQASLEPGPTHCGDGLGAESFLPCQVVSKNLSCKGLVKVTKYLCSGCYSVCFLRAFGTGGIHTMVTGTTYRSGCWASRGQWQTVSWEALVGISKEAEDAWNCSLLIKRWRKIQRCYFKVGGLELNTRLPAAVPWAQPRPAFGGTHSGEKKDLLRFETWESKEL